MKTITSILILVILFIFSENIKAQNTVKDEFYKNQNKETLYKGIYLGKITKNDKEYFKFQFDGVLKGKNRFLDVFFETNVDKKADKSAFIKETNKAAQGKFPAYLLYQNNYDPFRGLINKLTNNQKGNESDFSKLPQSPDVFFKAVNGENENVKGSVFFVSITGNEYNSWFAVELILWVKTEDGKYLPEIYTTKIDGNSELLDISILKGKTE